MTLRHATAVRVRCAANRGWRMPLHGRQLNRRRMAHEVGTTRHDASARNEWPADQRAGHPGHCLHDVITLVFPMEVRQVVAHELVEQKHGRVAIECGPLVYCAEGTDNTLPVLEATIGKDALFAARFESGLLGGINVVEGAGLKLIPYYAWANRETGPMNVWFTAQ